MVLRIVIAFVASALVVFSASPARTAPKIIQGFQSTAGPGPSASGAAQEAGQVVDDPADLFGDTTSPDDGGQESGPSVWDMPQLQTQLAQLRLATATLFQQGKFAEAEARCQQSIELVPHDPLGHYLLACTQARQGKTDEALASLNAAVRRGFNNAAAMDRDPNLQSLSGKLEFATLIADAKSAQRPPSPWRHRVSPAGRSQGKVMVSAANTAWDPKNGVFISLFNPPMADPREKDAVKGGGAIVEQINRWYAEGTAAGNLGDFYDNHDGDHSRMNPVEFPQLTFIRWDDETKRRQFHTGLQTRFFFSGVVLGNSSTALVNGPYWRSQPRLAYVNSRNVAVLHAQYTKNHLYFYPEHNDHDERHGDVYPANTPYIVISQGSSGSDQAFMSTFAYALAALRPDVKQALAKNGALMPTLQMIFRMSNKPVVEPEDYLTGAAHPTVFEGSYLQPAKMVAFAHELTADTLPPLVRMKVVEDDDSVVGKDYFDVGPRQELFTTPSAIARVHRTSKYRYRMVVSAEESVDLNGRPLTFHWKRLRGDDSLVKITPLNASGSIAEIVVPFHDKRPIAPGSKLVSNRVDVGCFVHNGKHFSAPGFVTFYTLANERRAYYEDETPQSIEYNLGGDYTDPMIDVPKDWKDTYHYDGKQLLGWTREREAGKEDFTVDGALIVARDDRGRPLTARTVRYAAVRKSDSQVPVLEQQPADELLHYQYSSPEAKVGTIARREKVE
jgi:hypothetical protein